MVKIKTIIANNIAIQGDPELNEDVSLLIKLYEPLPSEFDIKSECWIVERISLPQAYQVYNAYWRICPWWLPIHSRT